jgi:hypothetical protein
MKKFLMAVLACVFMIGIIAVPTSAVQTVPANVTLWADNLNINAGDLAVETDGNNLIITFNTEDGWVMNETHLYIGHSAPTKSAPGKFPFKHEKLGGITTDTYSIPLNVLGVALGDNVYIAAQAAIQKAALDESGNPVLDVSGNPVILVESAWAEGDPIPPGKNWAMFFLIYLPGLS